MFPTRSQSVPDLRRMNDCENVLKSYAATYSRNEEIPGYTICRLQIPPFMRLNHSSPALDEEWQKDTFLRIRDSGFEELKKKNLISAWVLATLKEGITRCDLCHVCKAALHGHNKILQGCGRGWKDMVEAFGRDAHEALGLPKVPESVMVVLLEGLASILNYTATDLSHYARRLSRRVPDIDFDENKELTELVGFAYRVPVLIQVRYFKFRAEYADNWEMGLRGYIRYMEKATCTGCRPVFKETMGQLDNSYLDDHSCMMPWSAKVASFWDDMKEGLNPTILEDEYKLELMNLGE